MAGVRRHRLPTTARRNFNTHEVEARVSFAVFTGASKLENEDYYRVDDGAKFRAFADEEKRAHGFARDLFVDLMRWSYFKGNIAWQNPRNLGLQQFPEQNNVFKEFVKIYKPQICETYSKIKSYLDRYCG